MLASRRATSCCLPPQIELHIRQCLICQRHRRVPQKQCLQLLEDRIGKRLVIWGKSQRHGPTLSMSHAWVELIPSEAETLKGQPSPGPTGKRHSVDTLYGHVLGGTSRFLCKWYSWPNKTWIHLGARSSPDDRFPGNRLPETFVRFMLPKHIRGEREFSQRPTGVWAPSPNLSAGPLQPTKL